MSDFEMTLYTLANIFNFYLPHTCVSRVRLFTDDTALYLAISSTTESEVLKTDLASLEQWEKMWDMQFYPS